MSSYTGDEKTFSGSSSSRTRQQTQDSQPQDVLQRPVSPLEHGLMEEEGQGHREYGGVEDEDSDIEDDSEGDEEFDFEPYATSTLFPPFYNRPPTPLPPSPSLTSLLRPTFSTTTISHPTTPDSSDVDTNLDVDVDADAEADAHVSGSSSVNLASITKSARHAAPVPRASPKIPTYEYYGFAMYLASCASFLLYLVWAYVPAPVLHQMGIHYYPNRWWALAVPCWLSVLVVYIYFALASYNTTRLTLPLGSYENLVDETGHIATIDQQTQQIASKGAASGAVHRFDPGEQVDWQTYWSISTDGVLDVPIGGVCEILYGNED
ncbi:unnamed protein product [Periconia digitata]|uniref:PIG-P domain-containing protein n=1 Tax=Periconia digitata TaxID=1303443 RepID=A0A9W4XQ24_9PLEO|nr:unnamed protein product [Periconia digitata]